MSDGKIGRWGAVVREAFAVLAAILIAFALDAWWDARVERTEMLAALGAVSVEIEENIALADSILEWNQGIWEVNNRMVQLEPDDVPGLTDAEVQELASFASAELMNPRVGALNAFISGGFLSSVDDVDLRAAVAGIPSVLDELSEEHTQYVELGLDMVRAASSALGPSTTARGLSGGAGFVEPRILVEAVVADLQAREALIASNIILATYRREMAAMVERLAVKGARIDAALAASR